MNQGNFLGTLIIGGTRFGGIFQTGREIKGNFFYSAHLYFFFKQFGGVGLNFLREFRIFFVSR